jgi:polyisoprenoid-binding protein YceI
MEDALGRWVQVEQRYALNRARTEIRAKAIGAAVCSALLTGCLTVPARAQEDMATFDPGRTTISFTLHDVLHTVHGGFALEHGKVTFDRASRKIAGELVVDATSGDSGNRGRDRRMHREILDSAEFSRIVFEPAEWSGDLQASGDSRVMIRGRFKMHGKEQQVEMPAEVHIQGRNPSTFVLRVSNTVEIEIHAVGTLTGGAAN